ncbi:hypothetical protein SAMN05518861_102447 [Mesorhizobium sp. YR577]|nr:hypothetical protein SAMN05518861_102447 [Mesorhizobium sp. YR577]
MIGNLFSVRAYTMKYEPRRTVYLLVSQGRLRLE